MAGFNKVILLGNLTRDPELRYTPKGVAIARFGIAVSRRWRSEAGEEKEEVCFVDVDCFGRTAETIAQYCKKGRPLLVEGRLKFEQWDDKQTGQKRSRHGVTLETFQFVGSKEGAAGAGAGGQEFARRPAATNAPAASAPPPENFPDDAPPSDDDVPF